MSSSHSDSRKTVLITGCSAGGIGHALALEFHAHGLRVFATSRALASMQALNDAGIETLALDVTDAEAVRDVCKRISVLTGGRLDILVNNAGLAYPVAVTDMDMDAVRGLFEVNLFAPMFVTQVFAPLLVASGDARVVQTGSISGILPLPFSAAYNCSKAALHALSNTMRVELAPFGIKVINVCTGGVESNISRPYTMPDDSLYKSMNDLYQERRVSVSQEAALPAALYAQKVVAETLRPEPRAWMWAGKNAFFIWFMDTFFSKTTLDWLMSRKFGMDIFAGRLTAAHRVGES
ncbi:NAD-P-binding protein [Auriscalpium vulgare]|uniref:NAD-P-binding protein n=1 Tax=Auriscalpium vulgare TaxID=40419 RepID=A0ACB8S535_9AGAM|nr:NAD-P-binding protein [Auriscalpium vulgare]